MPLNNITKKMMILKRIKKYNDNNRLVHLLSKLFLEFIIISEFGACVLSHVVVFAGLVINYIIIFFSFLIIIFFLKR